MTGLRASASAAPLEAGRDGKVELTLHVNGRDEVIRARPQHTLLEVLRNEVRLTGPREACGIGMCGACTVLVDGKPVASCLYPAALAEAHDLTTIEGLEGPQGELHPLQQAFVDHTGFQCSYCTPGFILTAKALLDEQPDVTRDEALEYLSGNLCRCGSYVKILDSVIDARDRLKGEPS